MPRSLQKATRCPLGIAIGTQQKNGAAASTAKAARFDRPIEARLRPCSRLEPPGGADRGSGATRRKISAVGRMTATCSSP